MHEVICSYLQAKQNPNARRKQKNKGKWKKCRHNFGWIPLKQNEQKKDELRWTRTA